MVTPSANRNSCRVAKVVRDDTQGRGAAHLNPGLGNRNSYRVAFGCVLAHIISTHRKDGDSQWPHLWAGKTVGLGTQLIRFPLCAVTFGLELPLGT